MWRRASHVIASAERCTEQTKCEVKVDKGENEASDQRQSTSKECTESVAATTAREKRVCLGVIPARVRDCENTQEVETYALLDTAGLKSRCGMGD